MNCTFVQTDLKAYCDDELSFLRRVIVRRHLAVCLACSKELQTMEHISKSLSADTPPDALSATLRAGILAQVEQQPLPAAGSSLKTGTSGRRFSPALVAGVCVVLAGAAFVAMHPMSQPNQLAHGPINGIRFGSIATAVRDVTSASADKAVQDVPSSAAATAQAIVTRQDQVASPAQPPTVDISGGANAPAAPMDMNGFSLDRQVHREAALTVQTDDPEGAGDKVDQIVKEAGGYVAGNELSTDESGLKSAQISVMAPVAQFDTVLGEIEKLGDVTAKNVTGEDITGKVSDANQTEAVLEAEVAQSAAHIEVLGRHATWEDENSASQLRIELAEARARIQLLNKLANLSNITVNLTQTPKPAARAQTGFLSGLGSNGSAALQSMLGSLSLMLTLLIWILAYMPIWGPLAFAAWYWKRRRREEARA